MRDMFMFLVSPRLEYESEFSNNNFFFNENYHFHGKASVDGYMVRLQGEQHKSSNVRIIYANKEIRVNA